MSKSDLKGAIANLKIARPFDLRGQGKAAFKTPQIEAPQTQAPQTQAPQSPVHVQPNQIEQPQKEVAQIQTPQIEVTQNKPPRIEAPQEKGFFQLAHAVFSNVTLRSLPGDAFRLFLWMSTHAWRFPSSDGTLIASVSFIEVGTGVSHATISRCLSLLRNCGLIELLATDYKKGNLWKVSPLARYEATQSKVPYNEVAGNEGPQSEEVAPSIQVNSSLKMRRQPPQNEGQLRTLQKDQKISLSRKATSDALRNYFEGLKPEKKRESEFREFQRLKGDYSDLEIETAFRFLQQSGIGGSGEICHSPMAFLGLAMTETLKLAKEKEDKEKERRVNQQASLKAESDRLTQELEEEKEWLTKHTAFCQRFPTEHEQRDALEQLCRGTPYRADSNVGRAFGVGRWWSTRSQ